MEPSAQAPKKPHRPSRNKKKNKGSTGTGGKKNAVAKPGAFARRVRLAADRAEKRAPNPNVPIERINGDAAPRMVAVVGPSDVGKTTIIRNLVRHYSKRKLPSVTGPITLVAGRKKRLTFVEVGADLSAMIDAAKVADLVLLVIDAAYGFEMETFEFLNIAAAHGMPKIIAVLTHLDKLPDGRQVRRAKKTLKDRIWAELYDGAKVFYLSGITTTGDYLSREILNLARFISVAKQANLRWRLDHPYLVADRVEDVTDKSQPAHADRTVALYGYIRGAPLRPMNGQWRVHLAGVSDLLATGLEALPDPCPPPEVASNEATQKDGANGQRQRRRVSERERVVHAPMAPEVDGISYDRDAVYIDLAPDNIRFSDKKVIASEQKLDPSASEADTQALDEDSSDGEGEKMVKRLQKGSGNAVDESLKRSELQLVTGGKRLVSEQFSDARKRRPADFGHDSGGDDDGDSSDETDEGESDSSEESPESGSARKKPLRKKTARSHADDVNDDSDAESAESDDDESGDDSADGDNEEVDSDEDDESENDSDDDAIQDEVNAQRWKEQMLDNAAKRMHSSISASKALSKLIYDKDADGSYSRKYELEVDIGPVDGDAENSDDEEEEELFTRRRKRGVTVSNVDPLLAMPDGVADDMTKLLPNATRDWVNDEALCAKLRRKRWATGFRESKAAAGSEEEEDDGGSIDGDFEDLETGDVHHGRDGENAKANREDVNGGTDDDDLDKIRQEKIRKKQQFDSSWDNRGSRKGNVSDEDDDDGDGEDGPDVRSRKAMRGENERTVDPRRVERDRLDRIRQEELQGLDAETLLEVQGMLPGQYVRVELKDVPVEFVQLFDPKNPVILGGLQPKDDEGMSFLRARIRRHRFKRGVLKSSDPVIFSVGWRRFQSMPIYDTEDVGGRRRFLKYTPEFLHCNATFWGPGVSPGVGVVLCQTLGREKAGFRVAGTGVITEISSSCNVVKKLKLTGEPVRVHKNTAFIKGMFSSETEASKFIGASIRTVSGIRGTIKKAISEVAQRNGLDRTVAKSPAGTYRAGFEDRILLSDIVFLRTWVPVEAARFCSIAANLLERGGGADGGGSWRMRTIREVRQAKGMAIPLQKDSLYKEVERANPVFAPFKLSRKLESSLPYASKPKDFASKSQPTDLPERKAAVREERAVVLSAKEKKEHRLLQAVYTIRNDREKRRKETRTNKLEEKKREWKKADEKHEEKTRASKKRKYALEGARDARQTKRGRGGTGDDDLS